MKIGRKDLCPCGSGKKYKNCCLRKETMSIPDRIKQAVKESGYNEDIGNVLANMYRYMERKQWWGACHASCAALYVCLSELGYKPKLCIGEVLGQGLYFDHSWVSLDDKMIDLAISMTLLGGAPASDIWLKTNLKTHYFIPEQYWTNNYEVVKEMLPQADVYVYEDDKIIQGFIGINDEYIEGIFVSNEMQSHGIGKILLDYMKDKKIRLQLNVYQKNVRAISFYQREGFTIQCDQIDEFTGKKEYVMNWDSK